MLLVDLLDDFSINLATTHGFHHSQVLEVIVRLEQGVAGEKLDQDAPNAPNVTWVAPTEIENDLRCTVVTR